jgi:hypothetical protein
MKTKHTLLIIMMVSCLTNFLWAQNTQPSSLNLQSNTQSEKVKAECRTNAGQVEINLERQRDQNAYRQLLQQQIGAEQNVLTDYTIQLHIIRRDDGTGGVNVADVRNEIQNFVNPYFAAVNAIFIECGPELYHNSTEYYVLGNGGEDPDVAGDAMAAAYNVANVVNVYFVDDPDGACGWARFPWTLPADYIVIANGCADNQSTLVHELGHYFSLYHTHETAFGAENVTRNNVDVCYDCDVDGDLFCDTPADPTLTGLVSGGCSYTGSGTDACGVTYTPDPTLIMSYSVKACRTVFSASQKAKMTLTMASPPGLPLYGRNYLQTGCCADPVAVCKNITVNLNAAGNGSITPESVNNNSTWDCGFASWSVSPNTFDCSDVGANLVTLTITDILGVESTCQSTVTIADVTPPEITHAANNMTVECDGSGNVTAFAAWLSSHGGATAVDACGGSWSNNSSGLSNGCGATGSETVTFTFTDPSLNSSSTSATFTIVDNTPPALDCPLDIHLPECVSTATWSVTTSDICGGVSVISNPPSGSEFPKGSTTIVNVTATDDCGNTSNCSFSVTRDPDLDVQIDPVPTSGLNTCALGANANIVLGYGGGPTCVTLHAVASGGHAGYDYSWQAPIEVPIGNFTNTNTASPTFCAEFQTSPCASYTFVVTVTDIHGCTETAEVEVFVVNPLCTSRNNPKVSVCHSPHNNPNVKNSLCIGSNAVSPHLNSFSHNDCLGACDATCESFSARKKQSVMNKNVFEQGYQISVQPNPFNSRTVIRISAEQDTRAGLTIIDFSGRTLVKLFDGVINSGTPNYIEFDASNMQAGLYIARLIGQDGVIVHSTLMLVK